MEISAIAFIVLSMATYRMANMVADMEQGGPWDILNRVRIWLGVRFDDHSVPHGTTMVSKGLLCVFCNSVWIGTAATISYVIVPEFTVMAALPFALSGVAVFLHLR